MMLIKSLGLISFRDEIITCKLIRESKKKRYTFSIWYLLSAILVAYYIPLCNLDFIVHNVFDYSGHHTNNAKEINLLEAHSKQYSWLPSTLATQDRF